MSNVFRKGTALAAALSMVLSVVAPVVGVRAADASTDAANRLAALGVIVDNSENPSAYNLGSNITRREMLKVMMNLSSVEVTDACEGKFSDLPASDWGCKYAEAALAAGFIAANAKFRPNDNVTEAEALKMVMQATGVEKAEGVEPWAEAYRQAAVEAGLLEEGAKVSGTSAAKRSFVFVTADAAVTATVDADEDDTDLDGILDDLFGEDDEDSDLDEGTGSTNTDGTQVKAGDLEVSLSPTSPANGTSVPMSGIVKFASVDFTAGSSDIALNSVEVKKAGLSTVDPSTRVWFEKDGLRVSGKASMTSEGNTVLSFAPAYVVKAGSTETLDLYVELKDTSAGSDYQFTSGNFVTSAANFKGSFTTPVLRTANYKVATYQARSTSAGSSYKASNDLVELGAFTLTATKSGVTETRDELFKSITLYQSGAANLTNLANIVLVRNGQTVSTKAVVDGKTLTFAVNDTIKDGATATYYVKANIINVEQNLDTYQLYLKNTSDLNVVEVSSGFRANAESETLDKFVSPLYSVNGGDVKFERDSSVALSQTYAPGTSDVVLMAGTITAKNAVTLEDPRLELVTLGTGSLSDYFSTLYLQVGSSILSASAVGTSGSGIQFNGVATVNGTAKVKLYGTLKSTTGMAATTIKFGDLTLDSFQGTKEYVANQNTVGSAVGSIAGVNVSVAKTQFTVIRNDGLGNSNMTQGAKGVTVLGTQLSSTQGNPVSVSSASYQFTGSAALVGNAYATLYVDGAAVSSKTVTATGTDIKFDGFNASVSSGKSVNLVLKVDFNSAFTGGTFQAALTKVAAIDTVSSADVGGSISTVNGAQFTITTAEAQLATSDVNPQASLFLAGSNNNKVFGFKVTAKNDTVNLKDVVLTGSQLPLFSNYRLYNANGELVATSTTLDSGNLKFENIDASKAPIAQDKSVGFYVSADANTNNDESGFELTLNSLTFRDSNGSEDTQTGSVSSNTHAVVQNLAIFAKASNPSKEISSSALRFTVTASGKNSVTLTGLTLEGRLSGYDVSGATVKVYKDSVNSNNLAFTGTVHASGALLGVTATSNGKGTVDAGSTVTYIVLVEGAIGASGSNTLDWNIRLTDVQFGGVSANAYTNLGDFPITETK